MKPFSCIVATSLVCFALVLAAVAGPEALPRDYESKEAVAPVPPPPCEWTGFYLGLHGGGQFGHSENKDLDDWNFEDRPWGYSESGFIGGGQVGYNFQWRWLVFGAEFDGGYMNLDGSGPAESPGNDTVGESDSDFYTTLRGRLGFALDCWLVYGTGGLMGVNYETRVIDDCATGDCGPGLIDAHKEEFNWGYTVGGGVERAFGRHWSIKGEYLYFNLDEQNFSAIEAGGPGRFGWEGETHGHIVRGGLNFRF